MSNTSEIIRSRKNNRVTECRCVLRQGGERFVIDGERQLAELARSGYAVEYILATERAYNSAARLYPDVKPFIISEEIADYISDMKSSQGLFAVAARRYNGIDFDNLKSRYLILDVVSDPGNTGSIFRSAEAFGFDGVFLDSGGCDPYSQKAVRAAAGSLLRVPFYRGDSRDIVKRLAGDGFAVYGAVANTDDAVGHSCAEDILRPGILRLGDVDFPARVAVVIGNEGVGIRGDVLAACTHRLYIPTTRVESLNAGVAAALICFDVFRACRKCVK